LGCEGGGMENTGLFKALPVIVVSSFLLFASPLDGISQTDSSNIGTEPPEYVVEDIHGSNVRVLEEGETQWEPAVEGQLVDSGDEIKVGDACEATLMLENETSVHLSENSDMKVEKIAPNKTGGFFSRLQVLAGLMLADVKKNLQDSHSAFEVESNGVVCGVRGTAFEVSSQGDNSQVSTHEGKVEVASAGETHMVTAGNASSFKRGKFQLLRRLDRFEIQRFQKWRVFRQEVRQKRLRRIAEIRNHKRQPWLRRHPRLKNELGRDRENRKGGRKLERKKIKKKFQREDR